MQTSIKARLLKRLRLTEDVIEVVFEPVEPSEIHFQAGQFLNIKVDDGQPKLHIRPYSILSPPSESKQLRFLLKVIPFGRSSEWLNQIPEGKIATMFGPMGVFTFREEMNKEPLFIATGTGMAPLYSMLVDQLHKGNQKKCSLLWGLRYMKDIYYEDDLKTLARKFPNFSYVVTLSRPEDQNVWLADSTHTIGRVTKWLQENLRDFSKHLYYICGVGDMVRDVDALLKEKNVPQEQILYEKWTL